MSEMSRINFVIQKYRLDELTFIESEQDGKKLGDGKLMADATLKRFSESDPSGTNKYLDWMLFMAGGGQEAMEKSIALWEGDGPTDQNALRNQCHKDFVAEQVNGYTDDSGVRHAPVHINVAESNWRQAEERCRFEFLMGDQDIALEDGFGFYRHWPGKDGLYDRIVSAVQLWHNSQQKLANQNQNLSRAYRLSKTVPMPEWTKDDHAFMTKWTAANNREAVNDPIELDIYKGWKPSEYGQPKAVYGSISTLLRPLADIRKTQVLRDARHELIYEDSIVTALCPLTVGASLKYGCMKWCVSNRTDFDKSFDPRAGSNYHWRNYAEKGVLVFLLFKVPMPAYMHKVALYFTFEDMRHLEGKIATSTWFDTKNDPGGVKQDGLLTRIRDEHKASYPQLLGPEEEALALAGRPSGRAWKDYAEHVPVIQALEKALAQTVLWGKRFDPKRLVVDYLIETGTPVIKGE